MEKVVLKQAILKQMDELYADGVDFVSIQLQDEMPTVYRSFTREEFEKVNIIPKSNYGLFKIINGEKFYLLL